MPHLPPVRRPSMPVGQWVIQLLRPTYKSSFLYHGINIHDRRSRGGQPACGGSWGSSGTVDLVVTMEYRPAIRCRLPLRREHGFGGGDALQLRAVSGEALSSKLWVANTPSTWVSEGACGIWGGGTRAFTTSFLCPCGVLLHPPPFTIRMGTRMKQMTKTLLPCWLPSG